MNLCGECKKKRFEIRDEYGSFPVLSHEDCSTTILNGKVLNLLDEMPFIEGVEAFRLNFTTESVPEVFEVIKNAKGKLNGTLEKTLFDQETDTRGHFNKEII
jgi:putative protease